MQPAINAARLSCLHVHSYITAIEIIYWQYIACKQRHLLVAVYVVYILVALSYYFGCLFLKIIWYPTQSYYNASRLK